MAGSAAWRDAVPGLGKADRLVRDQPDAECRDERERRERRQLDRHGNERQQEDADDAAVPVERVHVPEAEEHVRDEVQGDAATERHRGNQLQRLADVAERLLDAEAKRMIPATIGRCR